MSQDVATGGEVKVESKTVTLQQQSGGESLPKGVAPIKKEFLVLTQDQVINYDHLPDGYDATKNGDAGKEDNESNKGEKRPKIDDRDLPDNQKRFKLRGQNKNKLRYKIGQKNIRMRAANTSQEEFESGNAPLRIDKSQRLCLKLNESNTCPYGSTCDYSHDLYKIYNVTKNDLMLDQNKPCFIYSSYGRCHYSVACLFSRDHVYVNEEKKSAYNKINHKLWSLENKREDFLERSHNKLENPIQHKLRKKTYDFKVIDKVMNKLHQADMDREETTNEQGDKRIGAALVDEYVKSRDYTKRSVDFKNKLYLAPLTTVGNLPFRRLCKKFSCDITCAEMSLCTSLLNGNPSEWSHLRRHESEDVFGAQITASYPDHAAKIVKVLNEQCDLDFIDINCGCPTEWIYQSGAGSGLMLRGSKLRKMLASAAMISRIPITVKMRSGCAEDKNIAHNLIKSIVSPFTSRHIGAITVHGRSRNQRYTKLADWEYINRCGEVAGDIPFLGSGDCISWQEYYQRLEENKNVTGIMIARGALISPWLFTEIKERRTWDISSRERLDIVRDYVNFALDHWGSDATGVENCRKYLLEWLSFACRYIPVGLLEVLPQRINDRPPKYRGRDELETLLSSGSASDWVKISEMFLGKVPDNFKFLPKHKANAYESVVVEG